MKYHSLLSDNDKEINIRSRWVGAKAVLGYFSEVETAGDFIVEAHSNDGIFPTIAADSTGRIHMIYSTVDLNTSSGNILNYRYSDDNGLNWSSAEVIAFSFNDSNFTEMAEPDLVIDSHDENKWAQSVMQLIKDPSFSDQMGKAGNQILKTQYNQELFYERIFKMYSDIIGS